MANKEHKLMSEQLLDAWLHLSMDLWNERFVSQLSYNESLVCHLLYKKKIEDPAHPSLTLMQLSHMTGILKSQMNKTLSALDEKGFIERERSTEDKRIVYISLKEENLTSFHIQHDEILDVVDQVVARLGDKRSQEAITIFNDIGAEIVAIMQSRGVNDNDEA